MKELNISDLEIVSGGSEPKYFSPLDVIGVTGAATSGWRAVSATATGDMIARSAARGGLIGLAGIAGWNTGTYLYHETPLGDWLSSGVDKLTGLDQNFNDASGNDYGDGTGY
ncbi:bacteriocin transporter [Neisseria meningitidis]|uniref:bacteriocin transporter n=1 Tax=Neisseria meningitidis TaxID=487 RepID=UPI000E58251F|nr:bacteriocin transporter [Neisseria meningitidis]MBH2056558.1 bacteriocin transporter [Neisseria meningitidis]MBH2060238.1 bacteriocin transporter [Neisseria meningitidis]MBH2080598.1 bacteriocin transporter [Neisseria meningitidis]MBH2162818.1 bacteriocin transporter [Neisseria meningitidis]MBH2280187.1 bacteriocin transporter [Neisseria meningitidis]